jgi:HSP20 family protein
MANTVIRWQPWQEVATLRNAMDRLFDDRYVQPWRVSEAAGACVALDVYEEADKYVVEAALPGVKPAEVEVSLKENTLTISGNIAPAEEKGRSYLLKERPLGKFVRTVALPVEVQSDKVEATFTDGLLRLALPKAPVHQARRIPIKAAG